MSAIEVEVDVEYLSSDDIAEHLRSSTSVLKEMLQSEDERGASVATEAGGHACAHCGKLYKTASTLHMHALLKHPANRVEVRCISCDKQYPSLLSLQKHVRYMHRFSYRCQTCYRNFETPQMLNEHAEVCKKAEMPCSTCGGVYESWLSLKNHIKYKHPEKTSNWCAICRRAFSSTRGLANHFSAIHPDGTTCVGCDKKFNSVAALQSHFLNKHDENGAKCKMCRKVFKSQRSLTRHLANNHSVMLFKGGKYSCGVCDARFHASQALVDHVMEVHTGLKESNIENKTTEQENK